MTSWSVDLSAVTFCDSSGLGMMFRLHQAIDADGSQLLLCDPQPNVLRLLEMADQSRVLKVRDT